MQSSKHQNVQLLQPYLTPPADLQDLCTSSESELSTVFFSMNTFSVLNMSYDEFVMEETWRPTPSLHLAPSDSEMSEQKTGSNLYSQSSHILSISKTFHTELVPAPNVLLLSSDEVYFYVHLETIQRQCPEAFRAFLDASSSQANPVMFDCPSEELNIILHALYDMSLDTYRPGPKTVAAAVDLMPIFGITVKQVVYPECALYQYILSYTPFQPLEVYAMAAQHGVHALAVDASSYLLNLNILSVSDDASNRMGPLYFVKLVRLHTTRYEALRADLLVTPPTHLPATVNRCGVNQQRQARQIWALFCSEPLWHTRPIEFAVQAMEATLHPMMEDLICTECSLTLQMMVARVRSRWTLVP